MALRPVAFALILGLVTALTSAASAPQAPPLTEIRIGALLPLSGDLAFQGQAMNLGLRLAAADLNAYLATIGSGARIWVHVEDTAGDPPQALERLRVLGGQGIRLVIGPYSSAELERAKGLADETGILLVSSSSSAPSLAIQGDNVFRLVPDDTHQAGAVAGLMWQDKIRAVIPIWRGDVWGEGLSAAIKDRFDRLGGRVLEGVRFAPGTSDFTAEVETLAARVTQATAIYNTTSVAVALIGFDADAVRIAEQARGYPALSSVRWYGSDPIALSPLLVDDTEAARFLEAATLQSPLYGAATVERYGTISGRIAEQIGRPPDVYAVTSYDALWLAAYASLASDPAPDTAALKTALLQTAETSYGATGWLGGSEQFGRDLAAEAERLLDVPMLVVTNVGNNGLDAMREVEAAPRDGHTLLLGIDFDLSLFAQGQREQDPVEDFIPLLIGSLAVTQIYIRPGDARFSTWDQLVAYAREHPGLKVATIGTPLDLEGLALAGLERSFGVDFTYVPCERSPERNASLLGGETDLLIDQPGDVKEFLDTGRLRAALTLWNERVPGFEEVPTAREKGAELEPLLRMRWLSAAAGSPPSPPQ
jgi:branched-chain amino acid transport system substrate-binding protein